MINKTTILNKFISIFIIITLLLCNNLILVGFIQAVSSEDKILAGDSSSSDRFGFSVSMSEDGNTALVGAWGYDAAYVFRKNGSTWSQEQKLVPGNAAAGYFGYRVSISNDGNAAIIGAPLEDSGGLNAGAAYVYKFDSGSGSWYEEEMILASNSGSNDRFGWAVAISGDGNSLIVGAKEEDSGGSNAGAAYVFRYNTGTLAWDEQDMLLASNKGGGDNFGWSVGISDDGNTVIIGAHMEDTSQGNSGAAYVFKYTGTWNEEKMLKASDKGPGDNFGYNVAISGDGESAIVGSPFEDTGFTDVGAAYIFRINGGVWLQEKKIQPSDRDGGDNFGYNVSIDIDGTKSFVGSYKDSGAGAAYTFDYDAGNWTQDEKIISFDIGSNDYFGRSVGISDDGNSGIVGADGEDEGGSSAGAAYIYSFGAGAGSTGVTVTDMADFITTVDPITSYTGASLSNVSSVGFDQEAVLNINIPAVGSDTTITIPQGTVVTQSGGSSFDFSQVDIANWTSGDAGFAADEYVGGIQFGISGSHLLFTKPVKLEIPAPGYTDPTVTMKVKHAGDTVYNTSGLTDDPNATCLAGIPSVLSAIASVTNEMATIYTCSASDFGMLYGTGSDIVQTLVSIPIVGGDYRIFAPQSLNFPSISTSSQSGSISIDTAAITGTTITGSLLTGAYFGFEDLKGSNSGYTLSIMSNDLVRTGFTGTIIPRSNILITMTGSRGNMSGSGQEGLFLLNGDDPQQVKTNTGDGIIFDAGFFLIYRSEPTTPAVGRVGMYGVQPIFTIDIPKYQIVGEYTTTFTMTLTPL